MILAALVVGSLGALLLVIAALGVLRLRDALARQHAATKAGTLALGFVLVGVALHSGEPGWWIRVVLLGGFLCATLPVASHLLARAATREGQLPPEHVAEPPAPAAGRED